MKLSTIALIGPESTGKTTLCRSLSAHYACPWLEEYARTYVEQLQRAYTYEDVERIAHYQERALAQAQAAYAESHRFIFVDTDLIITKVWFEHVYKRVPAWLPDAIRQQHIDLYLLCAPDLPWQFDPVRENPHLREYLFDWYKREIETHSTAYATIDGCGTARTQHAIHAIDTHFDDIISTTL
ncbi:MAG: AAA family ATPase [Paludibacteraceae bacterium]